MNSEDRAERIKSILSKLEPEEKDILLETVMQPRPELLPRMTIPQFARASGIPEKRVRIAAKGPYRNRICVVNNKSGGTDFIKTEQFIKYFDEGKL